MSVHGKDTYFALEDAAGSTLRDLSVYLDSVEFNQENDTHDNTTFGAEGHTFAGGLTNGTISLTGLWDKTASTGSHTVLQSLIGHEVPVGFEYGEEGNTAGMVKLSGECLLESYSQSSPVADLVKFNATLRISGPVTPGTFSA
jgi:hypothetical protein